jgi:hypothetical protein
MIVIVCIPCAFAVRVMPTQVTAAMSTQEVDQLIGRNSDFWPDQYPCLKCGKHARGMVEEAADPRVLATMELRDLTPHEAFSAFNGFGLPEEQSCSLEAVSKLLLGTPIRKVVGSNVRGAQRTIIDSLELWDGTRVYFGAGAEGAVIYRIAAPVSLTDQVLSESRS